MIKRLKRAIGHNFVAKVLCLLASVVLWAIVMNEQNPMIEREFDIPLSYISPPQGYKITRSADSVHIKVRGKRSTMVETDTNQFRATLDLDGLETGRHPVPVNIILPQGVESLESSPNMVGVTLDPFAEKQMRVEIITTGTPVRGMTLGNVFQENVVVTVAGPSSATSNVTRVIGYVNLDDKKDDFTQKVPLIAINEDGKEVSDVRVFPSVTGVDVDLVRSLRKKNVMIDAVVDNNLPAGYSVDKITVAPSSVEITGEEEVVNHIDTIRTEKISLEGQTATFTRQVNLSWPQGLTVADTKVTVTVTVKPVATVGNGRFSESSSNSSGSDGSAAKTN